MPFSLPPPQHTHTHTHTYTTHNQSVRRLLLDCYGGGAAAAAAVDDALVELVLAPGLRPGAAAVFLETVGDARGPLPEELVAALGGGGGLAGEAGAAGAAGAAAQEVARAPVPVLVLWGREDRWEPVARARALLAQLPAVVGFVELPGCGHCPQDQAPDAVCDLIERFVARCSSRRQPAQQQQQGDEQQQQQQQQPLSARRGVGPCTVGVDSEAGRSSPTTIPPIHW